MERNEGAHQVCVGQRTRDGGCGGDMQWSDFWVYDCNVGDGVCPLQC